MKRLKGGTRLGPCRVCRRAGDSNVNGIGRSAFGAVNGEPHPVTGSVVVLAVAHVYDERPEAASLLNLAVLCQRYHNRHDAKGRQQRRKARREAERGQGVLWAEGPEGR